jgi:hypothetical protein
MLLAMVVVLGILFIGGCYLEFLNLSLPQKMLKPYEKMMRMHHSKPMADTAL